MIDNPVDNVRCAFNTDINEISYNVQRKLTP